MFYKLKEKTGQHEQNGKIYKAGDIVETEMDLTKKFIGKFELIHDENCVDSGIDKPIIQTPTGKDVDDTDELKSASLSGKASKKKKSKKKEDEDVTRDFPFAEDIGVKVFKKLKSNGEWFYIIDPDEDNVQMNKKMLRKKNVNKFIASVTED